MREDFSIVGVGGRSCPIPLLRPFDAPEAHFQRAQGERNPATGDGFLPTQERRSLDRQGEVVYETGLAYLDGKEGEGAVLYVS